MTDSKKIYKKNKKELKLNYLNQKHKLKEEYDFQITNNQIENKVNKKNNPPKRTILEEIGNAITHGIGSIFSIIAFILMLIKSITWQNYLGAIMYFIGLFLMFTMSTLYHSFRYGSTVKRLFRRFDYSSIYLLIGATFAPILLCYIGGLYGYLFFIIQWIIIIVGIVLIGVFGPGRLKFIHYPLYLILGWSGLLFLPFMYNNNRPFFLWILIGGIVYTIGIIPFFIDKKHCHFIWHFFVAFAAIIQWIGIYVYIYN